MKTTVNVSTEENFDARIEDGAQRTVVESAPLMATASARSVKARKVIFVPFLCRLRFHAWRCKSGLGVECARCGKKRYFVVWTRQA